MSLVDKFLFHFWDSRSFVEGLIGKWRPKGCTTEKDYERSLYDFLHEKLPDIQVTKQYAIGRVKADIVVGNKVIIELKNNLQSPSDYNRLVGQLTAYKNWSGGVIVILCGATDKNIAKEVEKFAKTFLNIGVIRK